MDHYILFVKKDAENIPDEIDLQGIISLSIAVVFLQSYGPLSILVNSTEEALDVVVTAHPYLGYVSASPTSFEE